MSITKAQELRREADKLVKQARAHYDEAKSADAPLSDEDRATFDQIMADAEANLSEARDLERLADLEAKAEESREGDGPVAGRRQDAGEPVDPGEGGEPGAKEKYEQAFRRYVRHGMSRLSADQVDLLERNYNAFSDEERDNLRAELRDMGVATDVGGGFLVPEGFVSQVEEAMLQFGGFREDATVIRTASGQDLPIPTVDDTSNKGEILSENDATSEQDVSIGRAVLHAHVYSSKMVPISRQLLQDSAIDMDSMLGRLLGTRIGRITAEHFTTGDGNSKPHGIVPMATSGVTAAATDAIIWDELYDLKHSVNPAYRKGGRARWMFNDSTLKALKKIKDGEGRPLWQPGVAVREPDTIDGDPYVINEEMADIATTAKPILYGDLSKYWMRDVLGFTLLRLEERFAEQFQVAFLGFSRHDGVLVDAGTNPVKVITMS